MKSNTLAHSSQTPSWWHLPFAPQPVSYVRVCGRLPQWKDQAIALGLSKRVYLTLSPWHSSLASWLRYRTVEWAVRKEILLANARPCFKLTRPWLRRTLSPGWDYILSDCWLLIWKPEAYSYLSKFRKHSQIGQVLDESISEGPFGGS